ncbi:hypothetical protein BDR05DRAFT_273523 [Suillus weaverae]|nr:hypothetical protein BDR05DRAFT_273523 [Suillus weaverae]
MLFCGAINTTLVHAHRSILLQQTSQTHDVQVSFIPGVVSNSDVIYIYLSGEILAQQSSVMYHIWLTVFDPPHSWLCALVQILVL